MQTQGQWNNAAIHDQCSFLRIQREGEMVQLSAPPPPFLKTAKYPLNEHTVCLKDFTDLAEHLPRVDFSLFESIFIKTVNIIQI